MLSVLVDNDDAAAGADHTAHFGYCGFDVDGVFQRLGRVGGVECVVREGEGRHRAAARTDTGGYTAEHGFGQVKRSDAGVPMIILQHASEAAFAGAHVEDAPVIQFAEESQDQLDVEDARIDGGGEVLLVRRSLIEAAADLIEGGGGLRRLAAKP